MVLFCVLFVVGVVCGGFVYVFVWGRCSPSAVGLVVKYLVAIEMPRVRFPDGALSYAAYAQRTQQLSSSSLLLTCTPYQQRKAHHKRPILPTIKTYMRHPHQPTPTPTNTPSRPPSNTTHTHSFYCSFDITPSPHLTVLLALHFVSPGMGLQRARRADDGILWQNVRPQAQRLRAA